MTSANRAESFLQVIRRAQRGRLKIYLGYCPGVGKTYQMLQEAQRLKSEGVDVAVGVVETHGRADTAALITGLEVIPRRQVAYHGMAMEEMDLHALLVRKPQVVLVDELAHTNLPGTSNSKRYQDVLDLLDAGIHVISTLNLQHLESLYNTVEKLIGVKVMERLPDSIVADADQIVNVDVTPEDLQKRLKAGKVYQQDRVVNALDNFFAAGNLEQLRELTLREVASQIDFKRREGLQEARSNAPDQLMVCLSSRGPNSSGTLLRYGSRLAGRLNRNWYAVYVQTPSEAPEVIDTATQRLLGDTLTLANQLGATVFTFKGHDVVATIIRFAHEYRVGHVVIGRPGPMPLWRRVLGQSSVAERLIHEARGISVVVIDSQAEERFAAPVAVPPSPAAFALPTRLSEVLHPAQVVIWREPMTRLQVLQSLVLAAQSRDAALDTGALLRRIQEREQQGSTFLNEGVALPHARMEGLHDPLAVLGLAHGGISDSPTKTPIAVVFLLVSPPEQTTTHLQILAAAARLFQDRNLRRKLAAYDTPPDVLAAIAALEK